jgi:hypothetical protein
LQPIIETICCRLAPGNAAFNTSAGHLVLIKFVITSIPIYLSIMMKMPAWILQFLEKRIRAFSGRDQRRHWARTALLRGTRFSGRWNTEGLAF